MFSLKNLAHKGLGLVLCATVWSCYDMFIILQSTYSRHPIAPPEGHLCGFFCDFDGWSALLYAVS